MYGLCFNIFLLLINFSIAAPSTPVAAPVPQYGQPATQYEYQQPVYSVPTNIYSITKGQLQSLRNRIPSFGSLTLVLLLCYGISAAVFHLIKYSIKFWWPSLSSKDNEYQNKVTAIENKIESVAEKVEAHVEDIKGITQSLKTFLEGQVESSSDSLRYDLFSQRQEANKNSDLEKDIESIKFLLPTVGSINRLEGMSHGSDLIEELGAIKNEVAKVKSSIKNSLQGSTIPTIRKSLRSSDHAQELGRSYEQPDWLKKSKPQIPSWQQGDDTAKENDKEVEKESEAQKSET